MLIAATPPFRLFMPPMPRHALLATATAAFDAVLACLRHAIATDVAVDYFLPPCRCRHFFTAITHAAAATPCLPPATRFTSPDYAFS